MTVSELQQLQSSVLSLHEKVAVKKTGRLTLDIQISHPGISNNKKYIHSFHSEWYQRKSWLCSYKVKNARFCFPFLLFGGDETWTKDGFRRINRRDGVVVRASASQSVELGFVPLVESYQKTLKNGIRSFPAWRSVFREVVEDKPASSLVVSLGKALNGMPHLYVEDRWPINLEKGNSQASADFPSKV